MIVKNNIDFNTEREFQNLENEFVQKFLDEMRIKEGGEIMRNWLEKCWEDGIIVSEVFEKTTIIFLHFVQVFDRDRIEYFKKKEKGKEHFKKFEKWPNEKLERIRGDIEKLIKITEDNRQDRRVSDERIDLLLSFFQSLKRDIELEMESRSNSRDKLARILIEAWQPRLIRKVRKKLKPSFIKRFFRLFFSI